MIKITLSSLLLCSAAGLHAETLFSEDFNYDISAGATLTANGWNGVSAPGTNPITINSSGAVPLAGSGEDDAKDFLRTYTLTAGDTVTTSMDATFSKVTTGGDYFTMLSPVQTDSSNYFQRVFAKSDGAGGLVLGLAFQTTNATTNPGSAVSYATTSLSLNTLYSLSIQWNVVDGANNDTMSLFVNGLLYFVKQWDGALAEPTTFGAFDLRQGGTTTAASLIVDNISVLVVPEPSTLSALALSGGFLLFRRRRSAAVVS